jgi:cell division protein FtsA
VILDVLPQEFFVDGQQGVRDPIGMTGVRLGSKVHIVTASQQAVDNVVKAVRKAGLRVKETILKPLAASRAVLSADEKELGVLSVNLGGGTTGMVLYHGGVVRHTAVIGWGASSVTNDVAVGLQVPLSKAEALKKDYGCAQVSLAGDEAIEIPSVGGRPPRHSSTQVLSAIIEPRVQETLEMVAAEFRETEYADRVQAGLVLTGGGARLAGVAEVAEDVFGMPARIGVPDGVSGLSQVAADPAYAAAVGVVAGVPGSRARRSPRRDNALSDTVNRVREWVDSLL